jgi:MYXO-CTERM domain-containing protein
VIDIVNGTRIAGQQVILATNENVNPRIYANDPHIFTAQRYGDPMYALVHTSSGTGRDNNDNGIGHAYAQMITVGPAPDYTVQVVAMQEVNVGGTTSTHSSMCTGAFGATGAYSGLHISASLTGTGIGLAQSETYDTTAGTFATGPRLATTATYGADSGYLANLYGNNPNTQGRDFINCVALTNPGYGVADGYMNEAQTLFAMVTYGRATDNNYKNSATLTLLPGHTPGQTLPDDETPDDPTDPDDPDGNGSSGSGGGCSVTSTSQGLGGLVLLLGAMLTITRRRRRK